MYNSVLYYDAFHEDKEMDRSAWTTSLLMSSSGNFGKRGIKPDKLYKARFQPDGELIENSESTVKPIDKEVKDRELDKLMKQFNKK